MDQGCKKLMNQEECKQVSHRDGRYKKRLRFRKGRLKSVYV